MTVGMMACKRVSSLQEPRASMGRLEHGRPAQAVAPRRRKGDPREHALQCGTCSYVQLKNA